MQNMQRRIATPCLIALLMATGLAAAENPFAGTWKLNPAKISSPGTMKFTPSGDDGMTWEFVDIKATCNLKFDGKDYPCTGPTAPPGIAVALKRAGPGSFEWTEKLNGKLLFTGTLTVSQDGRMLTNVGRPVSVNEPITEVYERQ
jgi:hypothetical protein